MEKQVKFQCTDIGCDFHVGDGRVIKGPYKDEFKQNHKGQIELIPESIAKIGVNQGRGEIV